MWKGIWRIESHVTECPCIESTWFTRSSPAAVDASDVAAGVLLLQEYDEGVEHPVCYFSEKCNKCQNNYSAIGKERLALVLALQHFEVYFSSSSLPVVVCSDPNPFVFINELKAKYQRLLSWSLMLQESVLDIRHIKVKRQCYCRNLQIAYSCWLAYHRTFQNISSCHAFIM